MKRSPSDTGRPAATEKEEAPRRRPYQRPSIKVLDESEVLASFQITSAFGSWWV
jgi:hypothetical protein